MRRDISEGELVDVGSYFQYGRYHGKGWYFTVIIPFPFQAWQVGDFFRNIEFGKLCYRFGWFPDRIYHAWGIHKVEGSVRINETR